MNGSSFQPVEPLPSDDWKSKFGYTSHWFIYGFMDDSFLSKQIAKYQRGEDDDISHYKWAAYQHVLTTIDLTDRARIREFILLMEADPDEHLYKGAITHLVNQGVPLAWFLEFEGARFLKQRSVCKRAFRDSECA